MNYVLNERARDAVEKRQISVASMEHALTHPEVTKPIRWTRIWNIGWRVSPSLAIVCCGRSSTVKKNRRWR